MIDNNKDWQPATIEEWADELAEVTGLFTPEVYLQADHTVILLYQLVHIPNVDMAGELIDIGHKWRGIEVKVFHEAFRLDAEDLLFEAENRINEVLEND